jgi:hypothetical protein
VKRLFIGCCILLAGCADFPLQLQPGIDDVMSEVVDIARAPAATQKLALGRAQQEFAADPAPLQRVRLAALLATLPEPLHDDARALELIEPVVEAASPAGRFAAFLAAQIAERQRIAREADRLAKERATAEKERQNADKERQNADKERDKREEALRQQLEALRAIERGILEREERLRKKPAGKP